MKKVKFLIKKNKAGKFYYSIYAVNGKNLSPGDPQKTRQAVRRAIRSFVTHIEAGYVEVYDITKKN